MKEIKIVFNKDMDAFTKKAYSLFIDGEEVENLKSFSINCPTTIEPDKRGIINMDKAIHFTIERYVDW